MRVGGSKNSLRGFSLEGYRFYGFVIGQLSGCAGEHPVIGVLGRVARSFDRKSAYEQDGLDGERINSGLRADKYKRQPFEVEGF